MDEDFQLAIQLQQQFDEEYEASLLPSDNLDDGGFGQSSKKRKVEVGGGGSDVVPYSRSAAQSDRPLTIVDESWEMLDPSPDVRAMFLEFNDMFFWGKLSGVEVKWSPRMTLCAGVCSYEGRGGLCSIRLSEPLLKLRPRRDLVQTLLHEMIHALLFVTQNNRDRDGHGPEFCKHMKRINEATGANITVYHTFHDEVDIYRQHWWRCDGPCQNRRPYFGYVKRAMNRAPSARDPWWGEHQRTCGGTYTKIKEPKDYGKKGKMDVSKDKKNQEKALGNGKPSSTTRGSGLQDIRNIIPFSGKGFLLGGKSQSTLSSSEDVERPVVKSSSSCPTSSPKKHILSSVSSTKTPLSPFHFDPDNLAKGMSSTLPSIRPEVSRGQKPPIKRSVSNTRVFVNINGSPVRISKAQASSDSQGTIQLYRGGAEIPKTKQRSVQELFNSRGFKTVESPSTISNSAAETKREVSSSLESSKNSLSATSPFSQQESNHSFPSTSKPSPTRADHSKYPSVVQTGGKPSPTKPIQSKYFSDFSCENVSGAVREGPVSKKRQWDSHSSSAHIFDYFQRTLGPKSTAAKASVWTKSPAVHDSRVTSSSSVPSSASSSSFLLMVSCPACQTEVQASKINEHLDSCLT